MVISCNDKKEHKVAIKKDSAKTIEYDLSDAINTTEGAGAKADYINGKIKKCTINIYGEMGQTEIIYIFKSDKINVTQENFAYLTDGDSINTQKWTSKKISYTVDFNGLLIGSKNDSEEIHNIFQDIQKSVPFELK